MLPYDEINASVYAVLSAASTLGGPGPNGEKQNQHSQLFFNSCLNVDFQESRVTRMVACCYGTEVRWTLRVRELISEHLTDGRRGKNKQLPGRL